MSKRSKGRIGGPFVPLLKDTMKTEAWKALSHGSRSLYAALKGRYNSKLQNGVYLSTRHAAKELGSCKKDNVGRWFHELLHYGFIVMVSGPCLGVDGHGKAPHYRLTEEWYSGKSPTKDFLNWDGELFNEQKSPSYYKWRDRRMAKLKDIGANQSAAYCQHGPRRLLKNCLGAITGSSSINGRLLAATPHQTHQQSQFQRLN